MIATSLDEEVYVLESTVRGYHAYMNNWTPVSGQILQVDREGDNIHYPFAVATSYGGSVVGHLPIEFSKLAWHFLQHGGRIVCKITGRRKRSSVLNKGLVIPCTYTFSGKPAMVKKLVKMMEQKKIVK